MSEETNIIKDEKDLFSKYGVETQQEFDRQLYKATACGAWAKFLPEYQPRMLSHFDRVQVGSIIEGSDAEATPFTLAFPFTEAEWDTRIQALEAEADELWHEANEGAEGDDDEEE